MNKNELRKFNEYLDRVVNEDKSFNNNTLRSEEKESLLKNLDLNTCTVTMIHDGIMSGQFAYPILKDKQKVFQIIKETFDINVPKNSEIKFLKQNWDIDFYIDGGIRLYVAELPLDKEGTDIIDFCIDEVFDTDEEFNDFIQKHSKNKTEKRRNESDEDELVDYYKNHLDEFLNDYYFDNAELQDEFDSDLLITNKEKLFDEWVKCLNYHDEYTAAEHSARKVLKNNESRKIRRKSENRTRPLNEDTFTMKVWIDNGDTLLFEKEIKDYYEYEHDYFPHLQHCTIELWDGDDLVHNIQLGY